MRAERAGAAGASSRTSGSLLRDLPLTALAPPAVPLLQRARHSGQSAPAPPRAGDSAKPSAHERAVAWEEEIGILRTALAGLAGMLFLEFDVPRVGSRIDAALVSGPAIFPIEFKCGERRFTTDACNQVWDYGLDLKNFHQASHSAPIFPIFVATGASDGDSAWQPPHDDGVRPPRRSTIADLRRAIDKALAQVDGAALDGDAWGRVPYQPTPTIIEAARRCAHS